MKIQFKYDKEKDAWCLLNKGRSSNNSNKPTRVFEGLVTQYGDNPTKEDTLKFIEEYLAENKINISECLTRFGNEWESVAREYKNRAEMLFKVSIPEEGVVYLTVNNRCPYNIEGNYFFVSVSSQRSVVMTVMHELWHFYTWYGLGREDAERLGAEKYNELKEALTVLLNVECQDLFPDGEQDTGYPQHQELRSKILELWSKDRDVKKLWKEISK